MQVVSRSRKVRGVLFAILGGICWGLSGTCAEYLMESYFVNPIWLTSMRMSVSGIIFLVLALFVDRARLFEVMHNPRALGSLLVFGLAGLAFCQITYHFAIENTNSGTATVLEQLALIIIMFYSCRLSHRFPRKRELAGLALALMGVFLISTHGDLHQLSIPEVGLFWGLVSAIGLTCYNLLPTRLIGRWGSIITVGLGSLFAGVLIALVVQPWRSFDSVTFDGGFFLGFAGVTIVGTVMAAWMYMQAISDIGPVKASLLAAVEPVAATVFSAVFLPTYFAAIDIVGFACIITMVILVSSRSKEEDPATKFDEQCA